MQGSVSHFLAGALVAGLLILHSMVLTFTGQLTNRGLGMLGLLLLIAGLIFFIRRHGQDRSHQASFGELFSYGFKATAVATIIGIAFQWVFFTIFPEYREQLLDITREELVQQGLTEEQMAPVLAKMREFFWPMTIGGAMFSTLLAGALGSTIGAGVTKKP